jgi:hypothetical protein
MAQPLDTAEPIARCSPTRIERRQNQRAKSALQDRGSGSIGGWEVRALKRESNEA